jgi:hypothetical protein
MQSLFKKCVKGVLKLLLLGLRLTQIESTIILSKFRSSNNKKLYLFNVDLHTSIIADLACGLKDFDVKLVSWNLSNNNRNFRKFFKVQDPAAGLGAKKWLDLGFEDLNLFKRRYKRYLATFDGFIVCFPPPFMELFLEQRKPILIVIGTRYESPYTDREEEWERFNGLLKKGYSSGKIMVAANNQGDVKYFKYFTQIEPEYVPSLCEYTRQPWSKKTDYRIIISRGGMQLRNLIQVESGHQWFSPREKFGSNYSWADLHQVSEVLLLPYNISTMTLFELATAGVPVSVPSKKLLKNLRSLDPEILSELSFFQIRQLPTSSLKDDNPNKTDKESIIDWWLDCADFYDTELMPNVRVISDLAQLGEPHPLTLERIRSDFELKLNNRNRALYARRHEMLWDFVHQIEKSKA